MTVYDGDVTELNLHEELLYFLFFKNDEWKNVYERLLLYIKRSSVFCILFYKLFYPMMRLE